MSRIFIAALAAFTLLLPNLAKAADWYLAETENFRFYSYGTESDAREFAIEMERLDQALRIISGIGPAQEPPADHDKVTVFRFGTTSDMGTLIGRRSVAGFFIPRAGQPVAFVPRRQDNARGLGQRNLRGSIEPRGILFHEYTHYFVNFHAPAAYPAWYSEGIAELFYTIEFDDERFTIGAPPRSRAYALRELRFESDKMFEPVETSSPRERAIESERTYGHGWLLTSYLFLGPDRRGQLNNYVRLLNQGIDSTEAAEQAFGDLRQLDRDVESYRGSSASMLRVPYLFEEEPSVEVRRLRTDEEAVMDLVTRSKAGVSEEQAQRQVSDARSLVAQYPQSLPVLTAAMEVEFDAGNLDEAEALTEQALAVDPQSVRAALYRAEVALRRAADDPDQYLVARERFIEANNIVQNHPEALFGYYRTFVLNGEQPTENAALALEQAYFGAPFDPTIRTAFGHLLLTEDRDEAAFLIMTPIINNPHNPGGRRLLPLFESDDPEDRERLMERLMPRPYGYEPPEEENDGADDGEVDLGDGDDGEGDEGEGEGEG